MGPKYAQWSVLFFAAAFLTACYLEGGSCTGTLCLSVATDIDGDNCGFDCNQRLQCPDADSVRANSLAALNFARQSAAPTSCTDNSGLSADPDTADLGSSSIVWNETLFSVADRHARDMAANNFVASLGSDGVTIDSRVADLDSSLNNVSQFNAGGFANSRALIDEWLRQPGECARLLATLRPTLRNSTVTQYAMACRFDRNTDFSTYWSLVLASDQSIVETN